MLKRISAIILMLSLLLGTAVADDLMHPAGVKDSFTGNKHARATLIVYSSPTCHHCIHFEDKIIPELKKRYVEKGQLRISIRPMVLNHVDTIIYLVALSNGPGNRDKILKKYRASYTSIVSSKDTEYILRNVAAEEGINEKQFNHALTNTDYIQDLEKLNRQAIQRFDIKGTPTIFLNGNRINYDGSINSLSEQIDNLLNNAS